MIPNVKTLFSPPHSNSFVLSQACNCTFPYMDMTWSEREKKKLGCQVKPSLIHSTRGYCLVTDLRWLPKRRRLPIRGGRWQWGDITSKWRLWSRVISYICFDLTVICFRIKTVQLFIRDQYWYIRLMAPYHYWSKILAPRPKSYWEKS